MDEITKLERIADLISDMNGILEMSDGVDQDRFIDMMAEYDDVVKSHTFDEDYGGAEIEVEGLCSFEAICDEGGAWMWVVKYW